MKTNRMYVHAKIYTLCYALMVSTLYSTIVFAETLDSAPTINQLVGWVEPSYDIISWFKKRLENVTDLSIRATSADIPEEKRRLWVISTNGGEPQLVTKQTGVRRPAWGKRNWVAYEVLSDTNGDGVVDMRDQLRIQLVKMPDKSIRDLGEGSSPIWSPDGTLLAFIRSGELWVHKLKGEKGETVPLGQMHLTGELIFTNKRSPAFAEDFWSKNLEDGTIQRLSSELKKRYLWMGALSSDGKRLVMSDVSHTKIYIRYLPNNHKEISLTQGTYTYLEPAWSPDEQFVLFVSDRP